MDSCGLMSNVGLRRTFACGSRVRGACGTLQKILHCEHCILRNTELVKLSFLGGSILGLFHGGFGGLGSWRVEYGCILV